MRNRWIKDVKLKMSNSKFQHLKWKIWQGLPLQGTNFRLWQTLSKKFLSYLDLWSLMGVLGVHSGPRGHTWSCQRLLITLVRGSKLHSCKSKRTWICHNQQFDFVSSFAKLIFKEKKNSKFWINITLSIIFKSLLLTV